MTGGEAPLECGSSLPPFFRRSMPRRKLLAKTGLTAPGQGGTGRISDFGAWVRADLPARRSPLRCSASTLRALQFRRPCRGDRSKTFPPVTQEAELGDAPADRSPHPTFGAQAGARQFRRCVIGCVCVLDVVLHLATLTVIFGIGIGIVD